MGYMRASRKILSEPLTEQVIQQRLNHFFASWRYNVDGLYVFGWESDKLIWTKSGYVYEFEIKLTRADFRNDFKNKAGRIFSLPPCLIIPPCSRSFSTTTARSVGRSTLASRLMTV